ncbi:hypothetical protein ACHQM5_020406 [Ranunculus cassubicifolius]
MVSASGSLGLHSSVQLLQPSVMSTSEKPKKLKIKLAKVSSESEIISAEVTLKDPGNGCFDAVAGVFRSSHDLKSQFSLNSGHTLSATFTDKSVKHKNKVHTNTGVHQSNGSMEVSMKRASVMRLDTHKAKKPKIESRVMLQCTTLLKKLMSHRHGWIFNKPVDPVALQIPDYFNVITKPMDFGTINSKLENKVYSSAEEFAADVRLTFANALLYNPPSNDVHIITKELQSIFERGWRAFDAKRSATSLECEQQSDSFKTLDSRGDIHRDQASCLKVTNKVLILPVQRQKPPRKNLEEISISKPPSSLDKSWDVGLIGQPENKIEAVQNVVTSLCEKRSPESTHTQYSCGRDSLHKDIHKGNNDSGSNVSGCTTDRSLTGGNGSCESVNFRSSDCTSGVATLNEENVESSSHLPTTSVSEEAWESNTYDEQLSPSKALRAAILKRRFAATIVKARQKTLLDNGEKTDPVKMRQEKERLERQQREEKARIEAQIKAAEAATRKREELEVKQRREREREAARMALQQVERSAEIYENMDILKEFEKLGGCPRPDYLLVDKVLERLGLFIKKDYYLEEEDEEEEKSMVVEEIENCSGVELEQSVKSCSLGDVEEGEIAS